MDHTFPCALLEDAQLSMPGLSGCRKGGVEQNGPGSLAGTTMGARTRESVCADVMDTEKHERPSHQAWDSVG